MKACWVYDIDNIQIEEKFKHQLPEKEFMCIIKNISIDFIMSHLDNRTFECFSENETLLNSRFRQDRIDNILKAWKNTIKVLPITLCYDNGKLLIVDGGHRLYVAYKILNEDNVPILISNADLLVKDSSIISYLLNKTFNS